MRKITFILLLLICSVSFSQNNNLPTYFGIQVRPLFPTSAGGQELSSLTQNNYQVNISQNIGYSFGGIVRKGITKLIAFETGINYIQRNYTINMSLTDTNVNASHTWSHVNYEIPLNALIYIQLNTKTYMNSSLGGTIRFSPTDIKKIVQTGGIHSFESYGLYKSKIAFSINGNVGFEYRTDKKGFYYLGASISVPLTPIMDYFSIHSIQSNTNKTLVEGEIQGRYISLDLRYFFPNIKKKGDQPNKELI
jgi:hypothetical protein